MGSPPPGCGRLSDILRANPDKFHVGEFNRGRSEISLVAQTQDWALTAGPSTSSPHRSFQSRARSQNGGSIGHVSTGGQEVFLVNTVETLNHVKVTVPAFSDPDSVSEAADAGNDQSFIVSIDCEYTQKRQAPDPSVSWNWQVVVEELALVQVATAEMTYLFDCIALPPRSVCNTLRPLLESSNYIKLMHGLHENAHLLAVHGGIQKICNVFDTQLAAEHLWGEMQIGLSQVIRKLVLAEGPSEPEIANESPAIHSYDYWKQRPLNHRQKSFAAKDVNLLLHVWPQLRDQLGQDQVDGVISASEIRAKESMRNDSVQFRVCFDSGRDHALASPELMSSMGREEHRVQPAPIEVKCEAPDLISVLPPDFRVKFDEMDTEPPVINSKALIDVKMDIGRKPVCCPLIGKPLTLSERAVTKHDIEHVASRVGIFGSDNRAAIEGKLHRISVMRSKDVNEMIGLTMRFGRYLQGNADMILDLLLGTDKSILFLGEPGSGKTTIIREAARVLSEQHKAVVVVDTSNEVARNPQCTYSHAAQTSQQ